MADIGSITSFISVPKKEIVHVFGSAVSLFCRYQCKASSSISESESIFKKTSYCKGLSAAKTMVFSLQVSASTNEKTMLFVFTDFCLEKDKKILNRDPAIGSGIGRIDWHPIQSRTSLLVNKVFCIYLSNF